ncbi:alpha/beta hydrolase family protein [Thaumasiovibrio subtropicus]|uniref:alpha/beta hydrolase family protein n=1 Tax=Thaumasiovibrio subtropicus TaxID=1891207 RepID=UPI00131E578D|nr:hypothetical protein [Thaumasiovibrio subtropicus]
MRFIQGLRLVLMVACLLPVHAEPAVIDITSFPLMLPDAPRATEVTVHMTPTSQPKPVIVFSHGLGGSPHHFRSLSHAWAAAGFVVVLVRHSGSDDTLWFDKPRWRWPRHFRLAASENELRWRVNDIVATLHQLSVWQDDEHSRLYGQLDLANIGIAGHSFGALTAQVMTGQGTGYDKAAYSDSRFKAALLLSPHYVKRGHRENSYTQVDRPWLIMTGSEDDVPLFGTQAHERLRLFPLLQGEHFELVLDGAHHFSFSDFTPSHHTLKRRLAHHQNAIEKISVQYWHAYLSHSPAAKQRLRSESVREWLKGSDRWQWK